MRRLIAIVLIFVQILSINVFASNETIKVNIDGVDLSRDAIVDEGVTKVPLRDVLVGTGYTVTWNQITRQIVVYKANNIYNSFAINTQSNKVSGSVYTGGIPMNNDYYMDNTTVIRNGTAYAPLELLDILGVSYYIEGNTVQIYTKLLVVDIVQEDEFVEEVVSDKDLKRVENLIYAYGTKNGVYSKRFDYLDSKPVEELYGYLSELPETAEIRSGEYEFVNVSRELNIPTKMKLTRDKTLTSLTGLSAEFEPVVFYKIGGEVDLIGGYVKYDGIESLDDMTETYKVNYQETSWRLLTDSQKSKVRTEISKFTQEIKQNKMVIFLVKNGTVVYKD